MGHKSHEKKINFFLILSLVLLVPALVFANQNKNEQQQNQQSEKLMQERLKNSEDKTNIKLKALEEKIKDQNKSVNNELGLRTEALEKRMDMYLSFVVIFVTTIGFLITFFGRKAIAEWIKQTIESKTEEEVNKYERLIKEQGEKAVNLLISKLEIRGQEKLSEIENLRNEYEISLNDLSNKKIDINKPLSEETAKNLGQFKDKLTKIKNEEDYSFEDWAFKGLEEYEKSDLEEAVFSWKKALEKNPEDKYIYGFLGAAYYNLKEYRSAIENLNKAIELNPENSEAYYNRGGTYLKLGQFERAMQSFDRAIELDPKAIDVYKGIALAYHKSKSYENAIDNYNKVIDLDPNDTESYLSISEIKIFVGDYSEALNLINKIIASSISIQEKTVCLYLKCITERLFGLNTSESEKSFTEILDNEFELKWSLEEMEEWLKNSDISSENKEYISKKTNRLKKHIKN